MRVRFTLTMDDVTINGQEFDSIALDWDSDVDEREVLDLSHQWISTQNFLSQRMEGLTKVGESSLTIEPFQESEDWDLPELHP